MRTSRRAAREKERLRAPRMPETEPSPTSPAGPYFAGTELRRTTPSGPTLQTTSPPLASALRAVASTASQVRPPSRERSVPEVPTAIHSRPGRPGRAVTADRKPLGGRVAAVHVFPPSLVKAATPSVAAGFL